MSDFDEKLEEILIGENRGDIRLAFLKKGKTMDDADEVVNNTIDQIKQLISEVIGGEEVKRDVPSNKDDSYESLNAQFKVMKYNQEQIPIRNELRKELRHAFNLKGE